MSPRPRSISRKLPPNLVKDVRGGTTYYRYRNPLTGERTSFGQDVERSIQAAIALNAHFAKTISDQNTEKLVRRVITQNDGGTIGEFLHIFDTQILQERRSKKGKSLAEKTLREYRIMLRTIGQEFGKDDWEQVTLKRVALFLDQLPARSSNAHRSLMIQIWRHAIAKGIIPPQNIPEMTIPKDHVVERQPLSLVWFQSIREAAEPWFQNAMDLALQTLQRREDLVLYRFDAIQAINGAQHLPVCQKKTENTSEFGRLLLPVGDELRRVIDQCRDEILSPFLIHRKPHKRRREYLDKKDHWTAVQPEMLTREFTRLRDQTGACNGLRQEQRPSFHEIRALGAELYRQAGWADDAIQRLLGHSTEKMTKHYLDKHQEPWIVTDTVGLSLMVYQK